MVNLKVLSCIEKCSVLIDFPKQLFFVTYALDKLDFGIELDKGNMKYFKT